MKPRHVLRCLGYPALLAPSGEPIRIRTKKHLALLVYLAVEPRRLHDRDVLAAFLWPNAKPAEARHSLSTALSLFRARLGRDAIDASREKIGLKPGRLELDLDRLLDGDILGDECTPPLAIAGFLDGFDIADAPEFGLWKDRQQARVLPAIKHALVTLIDRRRRTGKFQQIEELAEQMLTLDDLSEEGIRAKMEARALSGDRVTALRVYEDWRAKLASELQAVPSEALRGIAVQLRKGEHKHPAVMRTPGAQDDRQNDQPFVNRNTEYQALYESWAHTKDGTPSHVLILGDSGIGKTTLVKRFIAALSLEGVAVARTQCYDLEQEIPYSAFSALVAGLLKCPGASGTTPEALADLAIAVPEVRRRFPLTSTSMSAHGEASRIRLTEAFLELLFSIMEEQPVLLVIDDVHYADDASLAVLHLAIRRLQNRPMMTLLISRPGDLRQSPQVTRFRENAVMLGVREIQISPLNRDESQALLELLIPADAPQPTTPTQEAIIRASAGYPMAVELLAQDWQLSGNHCIAMSMEAMTNAPRNTSTTVYKQSLQRLKATLNVTAQSALSLAAILGHRLNDFDIYSLIGLDAPDVITGMTELVNRHVLRDNGQGLEFVNELVRNAAYFDLPSPVRKRLHRQVADYLLKREVKNNAELDLEIAWHEIRAGRTHEAIQPLLRGASSALRRGAPHAAEHALSSALPILEDPARTHAILLLTTALQEQSRWQDSLSVLQLLESTTSDLARVLRTIAERRSGQYTLAQLPDVIRDLIHLARYATDEHSKVRAVAEVASILEIVRSKSLSAELLSTINALPDSNLDHEHLAQLILARAMTHYRLGNYEKSIRDIETGLGILDGANIINSLLATFQSGLGSIYGLLGNYTLGRDWLNKANNTATRVGNELISRLTTANLALVHTRLGEYDKALSHCNLLLQRKDLALTAAARATVISHAMLGNSSQLDASITEYTERLKRHHSIGIHQEWDLTCADGYLMLGRAREALDVAQRAISLSEEGPILDSCIGLYARWVVQLGRHNNTLTQAVQRINGFLESAPKYHALDRAEILVAKIWAEDQTGNTIPKARQQEAKQKLATLPEAVSRQLKRLNMLDWL